jgi:hypothetical protein
MDKVQDIAIRLRSFIKFLELNMQEDQGRFADNKQFCHDDYYALIAAVKRELDDLDEVCGIADVRRSMAVLEAR